MVNIVCLLFCLFVCFCLVCLFVSVDVVFVVVFFCLEIEDAITLLSNRNCHYCFPIYGASINQSIKGLTCTFRASCYSARLSWALLLTYVSPFVRDKKVGVWVRRVGYLYSR